MKIGLISNLRSKRNRRAFPDVPAAGDRQVELIHRRLEGVNGLGEALAEFARAEVGVIAINGGDGTVSAVLTELLGRRPFSEQPALALLSGGTTNMCAADVGLKGGNGKAMRRLIERAARPDLDATCVEREVFRVAYRPDRTPVYGMFFGTAAICRAITLCREMIHPLKIESSAASAATLGYLLLRRAVRRGGDDSVMRGDTMTVDFDGEPGNPTDQLLALVTTLDRLVLGSRPFWGNGGGALRYTGIAYPPRRLLRFAHRILYGGADRRLPAGHYVSRNIDRISFAMSCPFTVDGELFQPVEGTPVELDQAGRVRFVRC